MFAMIWSTFYGDEVNHIPYASLFASIEDAKAEAERRMKDEGMEGLWRTEPNEGGDHGCRSDFATEGTTHCF